jgi:hypothetical protein
LLDEQGRSRADVALALNFRFADLDAGKVLEKLDISGVDYGQPLRCSSISFFSVASTCRQNGFLMETEELKLAATLFAWRQRRRT